MTVSTTLNRVSYVGNGSTTVFAYPFKIFEDADLEVYLNGVLQTLTTHYTVSGKGSLTGGNVTFLTAPPAAASVVIIRNLPETQASALPANDKFPSTTVETALDKLTMLVQELKEVDQRTLKLAVTSLFSNLSVPDPAAGLYLRWKNDKTGLENATLSSLGSIIAAGLASGQIVFADSATGITSDASLLWDQANNRMGVNVLAVEAAPLTVGADALDAFFRLKHASSTFVAKRENIAGMGASEMLSLAPTTNDELKLYLASVSGGMRVYLWDDAVAMPNTVSNGIKPAFAVHGDVLLGDIDALGNQPMTYFRRPATGLIASAITQFFSAKNMVNDTDGGAGFTLGPATGSTDEDGIAEIIAYGKGSGSLANCILLTTRSGAGAVTRRWVVQSAGHLVPATDNTYDIGTTLNRVRDVFAKRLRGQGGAGTANGIASVVLNADTASGTGSPGNTTENTLKTYTVPANTLETNGDLLRVTMSFRCAANATTKRIRIKFGGVMLLDSSAIAHNAAIINVVLYIIRTGSLAQYCQGVVNETATHNVWSTAITGDVKDRKSVV